ncbi:hypothetical protein B0J15DRAFT_543670 [Fusarium solani]|uniref:Uncharacterized protein n=2 Tax=Fusarium solani TaxID=169388 RepID=A0A9P9L2M3_FUSSL|nr:uncharacterized protein B0J15DRAFT_543670 [Fusarium solani]KAH7273103.1 hypothetical protein B0J15DRAFT_543670 [Fusarium solani]
MLNELLARSRFSAFDLPPLLIKFSSINFNSGSSLSSTVTNYPPTSIKMSSPSRFDRILQSLTVVLLTGLVVILALVLAEFKRMTNPNHGIVLKGNQETPVKVALPAYIDYLGSRERPIHVTAIPAPN